MHVKRPKLTGLHSLVPVLLTLLLPAASALAYEQPEYTVLLQDGDIEYRRYEPYLVAETAIQDARNISAAGNEGFRRLFRYISGEKISMTAPVQQTGDDSGWTVSFMIPSAYTLATAPQPSDSRVYVREVPGRLMAVRRFAGRWTRKNFAENEAVLLNAVRASNVQPVGEIERAVYNAPFSLPFLRRNEVMTPVSGLPNTAAGRATASRGEQEIAF